MSQSKGNIQKNFLCPQCHQDMSNADMLQVHLQTVHTKQSSTNTKTGLFSLARQRIIGVQGQDNLKPLNEPLKPYTPFFSSNSNDTYSKVGYMRSYDDYFQHVRKTKVDQIIPTTRQLLLRLELLTNTNENIPRNGNTKERQKYEQNVVAWMEDAVSSICVSCSKSFGLFARKHHCRLDGRIICNQCSQFISFTDARWIIELNGSSIPKINDVTRLRLNNLLNITCSIIIKDGTNEEYLRICLPCGRFLQKNYDKIRFRNIEKDQLFHHYEKIVEMRNGCEHIHSTYSTVMESLSTGATNYPISDAQQLYQQLNLKYDKIDSMSRIIARLADSGHQNDKCYTAICRNIRAYSIQVLKTYSKLTKRPPSKDDVQRISDEHNVKSTNNPPEQLKPVVRQNSQVIQFVRQEESANGDNEVVFINFN